MIRIGSQYGFENFFFSLFIFDLAFSSSKHQNSEDRHYLRTFCESQVLFFYRLGLQDHIGICQIFLDDSRAGDVGDSIEEKLSNTLNNLEKEVQEEEVRKGLTSFLFYTVIDFQMFLTRS